MRNFGLFLISVFMMVLASNTQSVSTLNNHFSTYGHNIKTKFFEICKKTTDFLYIRDIVCDNPANQGVGYAH